MTHDALVPTLRVGTPARTLRVPNRNPAADVSSSGQTPVATRSVADVRTHAERGHEKKIGKK